MSTPHQFPPLGRAAGQAHSLSIAAGLLPGADHTTHRAHTLERYTSRTPPTLRRAARGRGYTIWAQKGADQLTTWENHSNAMQTLPHDSSQEERNNTLGASKTNGKLYYLYFSRLPSRQPVVTNGKNRLLECGVARGAPTPHSRQVQQQPRVHQAVAPAAPPESRR